MSLNNQLSKSSGIKIDLSRHADKFCTNSQELLITKKVNFIFGKNGTGKTTITDEMFLQLSELYDVCVFKDFDGVVENERLNAISLGTENAKIQKLIDEIDIEISKIRNQITDLGNGNRNLFSNLNEAKRELDIKENELNRFLTNSAKKIKELSNPQIAKYSYNKSDFSDDILNAKNISNEDVSIYKSTIREIKKNVIESIDFTNLDLNGYLISTNEILRSSVNQKQYIFELNGNTDKQSFARQGMKIHEHRVGEICSFCGNEITEERWLLLGNYFNESVKNLEQRIENGISKIKANIEMVKNIEEIDDRKFYEKFKSEIEIVNLKINSSRKDYIIFLGKLENALVVKKNNLFIQSKELDLLLPVQFSEIKKDIDILIKTNNDLTSNLKSEQEIAKNCLRYHEVSLLLEEFKYSEKYKNKNVSENNFDNLNKEYQNSKIEVQNLQTKRKSLILQTKDEEIVAEKINKLLSSMGVLSFSLKLVNEDNVNHKGQYQILGYNGEIRTIINLSRGEKNIIAFLYFIFNLESIDINDKPKLIIFDDPMTSNDDTMQYLMIGEIQKYYHKIKDGNFIVILTHNCHFYLNVRPNTGSKYKYNGEEVSYYEKYGNFYLISDGKRSTIKNILKGKDDFKTSYETLWKELIFLYNSIDASADLMLNPSRKICETYMNFTKKGIEAFYGDNTNAKKLFDVNQHSIDDFEADINGKTKEEIKVILKELFTRNSASDHFESYWKE
ncbi:MAG: AAA family ATPase [Mobilitalea sp.]